MLKLKSEHNSHPQISNDIEKHQTVETSQKIEGRRVTGTSPRKPDTAGPSKAPGSRMKKRLSSGIRTYARVAMLDKQRQSNGSIKSQEVLNLNQTSN